MNGAQGAHQFLTWDSSKDFQGTLSPSPIQASFRSRRGCQGLGVLVSARLLQLSHDSVDSDEDKYQYSYRGNNIEFDCEWIEYSVL